MRMTTLATDSAGSRVPWRALLVGGLPTFVGGVRLEDAIAEVRLRGEVGDRTQQRVPARAGYWKRFFVIPRCRRGGARASLG
ncbi:MAG: hypothetical protein GEV06_25115 [Luteitalea sp.]|nr:hypothetical protein [Luteitalea sp.]